MPDMCSRHTTNNCRQYQQSSKRIANLYSSTRLLICHSSTVRYSGLHLDAVCIGQMTHVAVPRQEKRQDTEKKTFSNNAYSTNTPNYLDKLLICNTEKKSTWTTLNSGETRSNITPTASALLMESVYHATYTYLWRYVCVCGF